MVSVTEYKLEPETNLQSQDEENQSCDNFVAILCDNKERSCHKYVNICIIDTAIILIPLGLIYFTIIGGFIIYNS